MFVLSVVVVDVYFLNALLFKRLTILKGTRILMTITYDPEIEELDIPPTETLPQHSPGGWSLQPQPRIGLDLGSDDEMLLVENETSIPWLIYKDYHLLGIIDPSELLVFHICKHGSLNVRPMNTQDSVEYLVLSLNYFVNQVYIYKRHIGKEIEIYEMRAA